MYANDDYKDFWNEYKLVQENRHLPVEDEDHTKLEVDEVENNTELLRVMGMGHLVEVFNQCREISETELDVSLQQLSRRQADTVRKRVRALNFTVRSRIPGRQPRGWQRKPDIRNVFRDAETSSTGTRSRSATPDSLDSIGKDGTQVSPIINWQSTNWNTTDQPSSPKSLVGSVPSFVKIFNQSDATDNSGIAQHHRSNSSENEKDTLRRTPSAPPSCNRGVSPSEEDTSNNLPSSTLPSTEMFGRPSWNHYRGAVASNSEGIELLGFNRIGTMYCPRNSRERGRLLREPSDNQMANRNVDALIDSPTLRSNVTTVTTNGPMSFEFAFSKNIVKKEANETVLNNSNERISVNKVTDLDFKDMTPILWVEICMLFDKHSLKIHRRKPLKRKRKEDGNLFGVNLSTLVMRDYQFINDTSVIPVPLIIRDLLSRLSVRNRLCEEGLLRVAGNKQRVELLCNELEQNYYSKQEQIIGLLDKSTSHELVSVLKKLLRDLPQPLFTVELIHLFYESHAIKDESDHLNALNLLVLLLPVENRTTLYALLQFLIDIVHNEQFNKMNLHNVAMIIAPSLFPPRYIFTNRTMKNDLNSEIAFAATCCKLTEILIQGVELLQTIPMILLKQARNCTTETPHCYRRTKIPVNDSKQLNKHMKLFTKKDKK